LLNVRNNTLEPTHQPDPLDGGLDFLQPAESEDFDVDARGEERQRRCSSARGIELFGARKAAMAAA